MKEVPQGSPSYRKLNPHVFKANPEWEALGPKADVAFVHAEGTAKRIRQSSKPLLNKLEQEWFDFLCIQHHHLFAQSITFKLANGLKVMDWACGGR